MTKIEAIEYCTKRYQEQCDRYPQTREIGLTGYLQRNVSTIMRWRNSAEYRQIQATQQDTPKTVNGALFALRSV